MRFWWTRSALLAVLAGPLLVLGGPACAPDRVDSVQVTYYYLPG